MTRLPFTNNVLLEEVILWRFNHLFEEAVTETMLMTIGSSEDGTHAHQLQWLKFLWQTMRRLKTDTENKRLSEEEKEEHRRCVQSTYLADANIHMQRI
jgi:hypothetical protein